MNILLLEDNLDLGLAVSEHLQAAGHAVVWCKLISDARRAAPTSLALLDLHLPDGSGLDLLREWRAGRDMRAAIVLTARDQVSDRVRGLHAGADDYLVKPFDLDELLARVLAVARRSERDTEPLMVGDTIIEFGARSARRGAVTVALTAMEWAVLDCIGRRPGRIYSRVEIEDRLAAEGIGDASSNSLEVIVSRLRRKLGTHLISTHRGLGYRLDV